MLRELLSWPKIKEILTHRVTTDVATLFTGRSIAAGISLLIGFIIARSLGPADFGLYSIAMVVFGIAVVVAEMGLGTSLARYVPLYTRRDETKANYYLQTGFWTLLVSGLSISLLGLFLARPIALHIYGKPQLIIPISLGFLSVWGGILWSYFLSTLHAKELFKKYAILNVLVNFLKLGAIGAIYWLSRLTVANLLLLQVFLPILGFIIGMLLAPIKLVGIKGNLKNTTNELLHFGKWIFIIDITVMLCSRVDLLLLGYFAKDDVVGFYSAAYTLIFAFTLLTSSLNNVLLPRVAKMVSLGELKEYIRKISKATGCTAIFLLPVFYLVDPIVRLGYGEAYLASISLFRLMFIGNVFSFVVDPICLVAYAVNRPQLLTLVCFVKLGLSLSANLLLIPDYGATGAAIATLVTNIIGGGIALYFIFNYALRTPLVHSGSANNELS